MANKSVAKIPLTRGYFTLIDKEDFEKVSVHSWYANVSPDGQVYAIRVYKRRGYKLHRVLIGAKAGEMVDHINGDSLDNRKINLRIVSPTMNNANQKPRKNKKYSNFKGVSYLISGNRSKRWTSSVQIEGKTIRLGYFLTEEDAFQAYRKKHLELFKNNSYFKRREYE